MSKSALFPLRKLALIVGNGNYNEPNSRLDYSVDNAKDLSNSLNKINFDVILHTNPKTNMMKVVRDFTKTIENGDLILFYFSGYGYQLNERNYLIPVYDEIIQNERDVQEFGIDVEQIFTLLTERNPSYATIVVLDCSRPYQLRKASTSNSEYQVQ